MSKLKLYVRTGGWRWTLRARNGRIIGASTQAYKRRADAFRNIKRVIGIDYLSFGVNPRDSSWEEFVWSIDR
jgi:uncharacterized protein YegP (UPF0339 family)